jgi:Aldo/keto reductase family
VWLTVDCLRTLTERRSLKNSSTAAGVHIHGNSGPRREPRVVAPRSRRQPDGAGRTSTRCIWPDPTVPAAETAGALRELVTEGKIGHVGVSNHNAAQMAEFSATLPVETLEPPYHPFRREIEDGELPYCRAHNIGPLAYGLLTGTLSTHTAFAAMIGAAQAGYSVAALSSSGFGAPAAGPSPAGM